MTSHSLTFDAVSEAQPGPKWRARWDRSWPAYQAWFTANGGDAGPSRAVCEGALRRYMPELVPVHRKLVALAGGDDRAARFLSTWCPPNYLGGCSLACVAQGGDVRLLRNYDLSPDLNEGLLLHSAWTGRPVMGMVEFLWGLSDGVNEAGLAIALAYGGRQVIGPGFGITTILRHVLETCGTVAEGIAVLRRVPSHMPYNVVLCDATGAMASVEVAAGGGARVVPAVVATNHQSDGSRPDRGAFTRTHERAAHLNRILPELSDPRTLSGTFLQQPLFQDRYDEGFGTLFTAEYDPVVRAMSLHWRDRSWTQRLDSFEEGQHVAQYVRAGTKATEVPEWAVPIDWMAVARAYASGNPPDWRDFVPPGLYVA